jgi:hypothetical protein
MATSRGPHRAQGSTTLREAIETVGRAGSSSSVLAINTVHRLVRTMFAWIQTLEARRGQLSDEIEFRSCELEELERQIAQERKNAEAVAVAARGWANDIEQQVLARKAELQVETEALDAQLRAISSSLKDLPSRGSSVAPTDSTLNSRSLSSGDDHDALDRVAAERTSPGGQAGDDPDRASPADAWSKQ